MFEPRWGDDSRDRDDGSRDLSRGSRGGWTRGTETVWTHATSLSGVDLPRGLDREHVHFHGHDYTLRGSETRSLTSVGAFRVIPANDLRDTFDRPLDPRHGELWHLRDSGSLRPFASTATRLSSPCPRRVGTYWSSAAGPGLA